VSGSLSGIGSTSSTQVDQAASIGLPANLTPAQSAQVEQILGELASGAITASQAQGEIAGIVAQQQGSSGASAGATGGTQHAHHHHGHTNATGETEDGTSTGQTLSALLDLTPEQESAITSMISGAQKNGTSASDLITQIEGLLNPTQQQKLSQLLSPTYSSVGTSDTGSRPPLFSTTA
jgi:hypothetical protein